MENPIALLRDPLTMKAYLEARPIADPIHLYDCVMPCAGAEGFLVTTVERARRIDMPYVTVMALEERHNAYHCDPVQLRLGGEGYATSLFDAAGISHSDVDFAQLYDDYPVIVLLQLEALGFCNSGEGADFVRQTDLRCGGHGLPINTSGGQLSVGQAGFAGGYMGLVESIRQLTDQAIGKQLKDPQIGIVSGYGMVNYDRGITTAAALLARGIE